jgi:hypothetical protein
MDGLAFAHKGNKSARESLFFFLRGSAGACGSPDAIGNGCVEPRFSAADFRRRHTRR